MDRYEANEMATMALKGEPDRAFAMAKRIAQFVKTLVERPMQVARVYGLNKKLHVLPLATNCMFHRNSLSWMGVLSYAAATRSPEDLFARRGDVYSFDWPASPESAMTRSAYALRRSTRIYSTAVKMGHVLTSGSSENSGRSNGAWWKTPPS